jgi:hypothetical protein
MRGFYLLKRTYGRTLYLHPFLQKKEVAKWDSNEAVTAAVSSEITQSEKDDYLYELYKQIDHGVDSWIQELKYIPRLLNSAAAFLVIYFFLSFVIRDPIPVLDELLAATAGAAAFYLWTASKNRKSEIAMKKRMELKTQAEKANFIVNDALHELENTLLEYDEMPAITLADKVCGEEGGLTLLPRHGLYTEAADYIGILLEKNEQQRKILRRLPSVNTSKEITSMSAHLLHLAARKKIDLPLIALYLSINSAASEE